MCYFIIVWFHYSDLFITIITMCFIVVFFSILLLCALVTKSFLNTSCVFNHLYSESSSDLFWSTITTGNYLNNSRSYLSKPSQHWCECNYLLLRGTLHSVQSIFGYLIWIRKRHKCTQNCIVIRSHVNTMCKWCSSV